MQDPSSGEWLHDMRDAGARLSRMQVVPMDKVRYVRRAKASYHVVSTVEDFEGFGLGVRKALSEHGDVAYSCLWLQYEILKRQPLIERCPIFRTFHEQEPNRPYRLVIALSDVGSIFPLKSMISHVVLERGFSRFNSIEIIAATAVPDARRRLGGHLPYRLLSVLNFPVWSPARTLMDNGYSDALGGRSPTELAGFANDAEREDYTPFEVKEQLERLPRRLRRGPDPDGSAPPKVM